MANNGWRTATLGDLVRLQRGHDLAEMSRKPGMIPIMGSAGLNGFHNEARAPGPGVTIGRSGVGSMGTVSYTPAPYWPHNTVLYVTDFLGNSPRFVYYLLLTIDFRRFNSGSAQASLNRNYIQHIEVQIPPLAEQRRIAAILGALDDRIELSRQMDRTLEEMAQALFRSWFVDFDNQTDLRETEAGRTPSAWPIVHLDQLVICDPQTSLTKGTVSKWVDMAAVPKNGPCILSWEKREYAGGSRFMQGDVLLARITPCLENGKTALVDILAEGEVAAGSTEFIVMRGRDRTPSAWVYCLARSPSFREHAIRGMTGSSGRQRVSAEVIRRFQVARPPEKILRRFGELTALLFSQISLNASQSRTLTALREILLPKLIAGHLRVPESLGQALEAVSAEVTP